MRSGSVSGVREATREKRIVMNDGCEEVLEDGETRCAKSVKERRSRDTRVAKATIKVSRT